MTMHKKRWIIVVLVIIVLILTIVYSVLPVTFRPSVSRKLTPRVISINGIPTGSFYYYGGSYPANLTIVVEVTWNDWKPVRGAGVTIYGSAGGTDTNTTDLNGLAVLHLPFLPFSPSISGNHAYFSMIVWKGNHLLTREEAIPIYYRSQ
ncbi:MAG: hypothetical protein DRN16_04370 [Thermoplasmata archaeon]|nr:MAG: hypothetical protein DRN16_04370 [Thermoplasmata archaeon]